LIKNNKVKITRINTVCCKKVSVLSKNVFFSFWRKFFSLIRQQQPKSVEIVNLLLDNVCLLLAVVVVEYLYFIINLVVFLNEKMSKNITFFKK